MNMNPAALMKVMTAKKTFEDNHPKFAAFVRYLFSQPLEEGTVLEVTLTRPGQEPVATNLKVTREDLELLAELKNLGM